MLQGPGPVARLPQPRGDATEGEAGWGLPHEAQSRHTAHIIGHTQAFGERTRKQSSRTQEANTTELSEAAVILFH